LPFNIASYALLLELVAKFTGYRARHLTGFLADTHIYVNQIEQVQQQLLRTPFDLPKLSISTPPAKTAYETLLAARPDDISLVGYECHPPIKMEMAV
jgi:thymidylate synthase